MTGDSTARLPEEPTRDFTFHFSGEFEYRTLSVAIDIVTKSFAKRSNIISNGVVTKYLIMKNETVRNIAT